MTPSRLLSTLVVGLCLLLGCHRNAPSDPAVDAFLRQAAEDFNRVAGLDFPDKERKLVAATPGPGRRLGFAYRIRGFAAADRSTDRAKRYAQALRAELPGKVNQAEIFQNLARHQVKLVYDYAGMDGAPLFRIQLRPEPGKGYRLD